MDGGGGGRKGGGGGGRGRRPAAAGEVAAAGGERGNPSRGERGSKPTTILNSESYPAPFVKVASLSC